MFAASASSGGGGALLSALQRRQGTGSESASAQSLDRTTLGRQYIRARTKYEDATEQDLAAAEQQ